MQKLITRTFITGIEYAVLDKDLNKLGQISTAKSVKTEKAKKELLESNNFPIDSALVLLGVKEQTYVATEQDFMTIARPVEEFKKTNKKEKK
ncbi:hypothetical protein [Bacteroides acidifaciens]|uniref:hypothetical protein n=1 Tax=Bacteroides acidifaciens TaxID=85831 RepID=UPI0025AEC26B|nr:hypothetical protein [Bacteroides acidifaciens]